MVAICGRFRLLTGVTSFLLLAAFILVLLVAVSLPIINSIYLVVLRSTVDTVLSLSIATELRFGVWGVCATWGVTGPLRPSRPDVCFGPQLGYDVPPEIADLVGISQAQLNTIQNALLVVLVLHPVTAGLAFLSLLFALCMASHAISIVGLIITILTAILSAIIFAVDVALVLVARQKLRDINTFNFEVLFGNGVWMVLGAFIAVLFSVILLSARACFCCGVRRDPEFEEDVRHDHGNLNDPEVTERR